LFFCFFKKNKNLIHTSHRITGRVGSTLDNQTMTEGFEYIFEIISNLDGRGSATTFWVLYDLFND